MPPCVVLGDELDITDQSIAAGASTSCVRCFIRRGGKMMEWISVKEKLPEIGEEVLVYWENTSQNKTHYYLTHHDGDHWFCLDDNERPWIKIIAWMPLPEPPENNT